MKTSLLFALLFTACCSFAQNNGKRNAVTLTTSLNEFEIYNATPGFALGYQYFLHRWLTVEGTLSYAAGSNFPKAMTDDSYSDRNENKVFFKSQLLTAGLNAHITLVNNSHHFVSGYAGLGFTDYNATSYWKVTSLPNHSTTSVQHLALLSYSWGGQYRYRFSGGFTLGADAHYTDNNTKSVIAPSYFTSYGIVLGKTF